MTKNNDQLRRQAVPFDAYYFEKQKASGQILTLKEVFENIKEINLWGSGESASGEGSTASETLRLKENIENLFRELGIKSVADAPCGDFGWMSTLDFSGLMYLGVDILEDAINFLRWSYKDNESISFERADITKVILPDVDLILCRDCLVHFSFEDIYKAIDNFKASGSRYLLTTTFVDTEINEDIVTGDWRPLNLEAPPFCFSNPIKVLIEGCMQNDGMYKDKSLALWELNKL